MSRDDFDPSTKTASELVTRVEKLTEAEGELVLKLREREVERQRAEANEQEAKRELERCKRERDHTLAWLGVLRTRGLIVEVRADAQKIDEAIKKKREGLS